MDDGIVLRADVYRPVGNGRYPVILSYGVYANGLAYQDGYPMQWEKMVADHPEILVGSTTNSQKQKGLRRYSPKPLSFMVAGARNRRNRG